MQGQPIPPPESGGGQGAQAHPQSALTHRRLVRLSWITAVLVVVGGQLWLLLKLFFAPLTPGEGRGQFTPGPLEQFSMGSVTHSPRPLDRFATTLQNGHVIVDTTHRSTQ